MNAINCFVKFYTDISDEAFEMITS